MANRPIDERVRLSVRVPRGIQGYWDIMRRLSAEQGVFTLRDVDLQSNVNKDAIRDFLKRLERAGYVAHTGYRDKAKLYQLRHDQPEAPRLRRDGSPAREMGRANEQVWRTAKMLKRFTTRELAVHASTEDVPVREETAYQYLRHLEHAGYVRKVEAGRPGHKPGTGKQATYALRPDMITGPLAPQIQRTDWVWDPNLKRPMGPEGGEA